MMANLVDKRPKIELTGADFQKLLLYISRGLEDQELDTLKFLCYDESIGLKFGELESCKTSLNLFSKLETLMLISKTNLDLLIELMDLIRRPDLKSKIEGKCDNVEGRKVIISPYRRMVLELTNAISADELNELKGSTLKDVLPRKKVTEIQQPIQMMYALEHQGKISPPDEVEYLITIFEHLEKQVFAGVVRKHQQDVLIGKYKMDCKPHGLCIIINNVKFAPPQSSKLILEERKGSEKDEEKLRNTFTKLGFTVKTETDLTAKQMSLVIENAAKVDHSNYDCFVCCILSHGNYGFVTGVDGGTCKIMDIARHLRPSNCPSLAYKPKIFIIQACQGQIHEEKVNINISSTSFDHDSREESEFIPEDADFLFAYCTCPGRKSKINMSSGSAYISKLTVALEKHHKDLDILSILTLVNKEMCNIDFAETHRPTGTVYGQVPAPQFTLTKKLFFP